jgi:hypothetical protein
MADKANLYVSWLGIFATGWMPDKEGWDGGCMGDMKLDEDQFKAFIHPARKYGANRCRIFPYETKWVKSADKMFSPYLWDSVKQKWNLDKFNEAYFVELDKVVYLAGKNNIKIVYSLFDNCQYHTAPGSNRNPLMAPWQNNVQGFANYFVSFEYARRTAQKVYSRYGNTMEYEICNEFSQIKGYSPQDCGAWAAKLADFLIQSGCPERNICWGALPVGEFVGDKWEVDTDRDLIVQACRYLSNMIDGRTGKKYRETLPQAQDLILCTVHNIGIYPEDSDDEEKCIQMWGDARTRWFLASDDGQSKGDSAKNCEPDGTWRRGDYQQTYNTAKYILSKCGGVDGKTSLESLPSNTAPDAWLESIRGLADAYKNRYGKYPENYGTPDPVYPSPPECSIGEVKKMTCWNGLEIVTHTCVENKWVETGNTCPEEPEQKCSCWFYLNIKDFLFGIPNFLKCIFGKLVPYCKDKNNKNTK